jgi:hypothetical protein
MITMAINNTRMIHINNFLIISIGRYSNNINLPVVLLKRLSY